MRSIALDASAGCGIGVSQSHGLSQSNAFDHAYRFAAVIADYLN
jgi:hypothetical protein